MIHKLLSGKGDVMTPSVKSRISIPFRWILGGGDTHHDERDRVRRSAQGHGPSCEALESRVVLSNWLGGGDDLLGSLSSIGVLTGGGGLGGPARGMYTPWAGQSSQVAQLNTDLQKLQTELQGLAVKSRVTIVDLANLTADGQSIAGAGFWINPQSLQKTVSELATAVAGGSDTTQAKADFNALFSGSNVAQATIDKAFNDLVQTIQDSKVTAADLSAVAADQTAIQNDLNNLPGGGRWFGGERALSGGGVALTSNLATSLSAAGVATLPAQAGGSGGLYAPWAAGQNSQVSQLNADTQKLQTEKQSLAAKSGVTVADLTNLVTDSQAIAGAGLRLDPQGLQKVMNELATAVAGGADTTQAKADFNALFSGSNVAQTTIDKAFSDLVQTIQDSKVTAADLTSLAADQSAIQSDWTGIRNGGSGGTGTSGSGSGSGSSGSGSGSGSSGSGSGSGSGSSTSTATGGTAIHSIGFRRFRGFMRFRRR
jgi:hypothetical protein